jgi:hypothetical protein
MSRFIMMTTITMRRAHRNNHLSLTTYPKDTIRGDGAAGRIVYDVAARSSEVDFAFEICDTKDEAWYVACLSDCFLKTGKQIQHTGQEEQTMQLSNACSPLGDSFVNMVA